MSLENTVILISLGCHDEAEIKRFLSRRIKSRNFSAAISPEPERIL